MHGDADGIGDDEQGDQQEHGDRADADVRNGAAQRHKEGRKFLALADILDVIQGIDLFQRLVKLLHVGKVHFKGRGYGFRFLVVKIVHKQLALQIVIKVAAVLLCGVIVDTLYVRQSLDTVSDRFALYGCEIVFHKHHHDVLIVDFVEQCLNVYKT